MGSEEEEEREGEEVVGDSGDSADDLVLDDIIKSRERSAKRNLCSLYIPSSEAISLFFLQIFPL